MTTKADYTDEEWAALRRAPLVAGLAVSFADPGGPIELDEGVDGGPAGDRQAAR